MANPHFDMNTIISAVGIVADAAADTRNALGEKSVAAGFEQYGNLVPDLLTLASQPQKLPADISQVSPENLKPAVDATAIHLNISQATATEVVSSMIDLLQRVGKMVIDDANVIAALFKKV